ncbi:hypothetical protein DSO57_1006798 [Entomophthora muscae]|uniref:Uncharacterized protein n=1 Tax=Entomophthora muscae TaxID=34485 RepID=A0ACC2S9R4_9FUNG|nr:hypothetical protein DSO57_1006798 [Entomophthora muscae]
MNPKGNTIIAVALLSAIHALALPSGRSLRLISDEPSEWRLTRKAEEASMSSKKHHQTPDPTSYHDDGYIPNIHPQHKAYPTQLKGADSPSYMPTKLYQSAIPQFVSPADAQAYAALVNANKAMPLNATPLTTDMPIHAAPNKVSAYTAHMDSNKDIHSYTAAVDTNKNIQAYAVLMDLNDPMAPNTTPLTTEIPAYYAINQEMSDSEPDSINDGCDEDSSPHSNKATIQHY